MYRLIDYQRQQILAMSGKRSDIACSIESMTCEVIMHLMKIYLYPNSRDVNKWKGEVYNFFYSIPKFKHNNKFPSADFIFNNTYDKNTDCLQIWWEDVQEEYGEVEDADFVDFCLIAKEYYRWLSDILSERGRVTRPKVYDKLRELGL
jgi:hypothetical protein